MISLEQVPFGDLAGMQAFAMVPVSDRLVNELIARSIPPDAPVRQVIVQSEGANRLKARLTLRAEFVPPVTLTAVIEQQPSHAASPILGLRLSGISGLMGFAGTAAGLDDKLPPGVRMDGDRVLVNFRTLLAGQSAEKLLDHIEELFVTAEEGRIVISFRVHVR